MGWGEVFGKIFSWIPKPGERYRAKIRQIEKKMADMARDNPGALSTPEYESLAIQLQELKAKTQNAA